MGQVPTLCGGRGLARAALELELERAGSGEGGNGRSRETERSFCRHLLPAPLLRGIVGASASRSLREVSLLFPLPSPKVGVKRVRVRAGGWGVSRRLFRAGRPVVPQAVGSQPAAPAPSGSPVLPPPALRM